MNKNKIKIMHQEVLMLLSQMFKLVPGVVILFSISTYAGERVILQDSKKMEAEVSSKSVRCSSLGYGMQELKINLPALDGWTILDHSNVQFGDRSDLPCMTAGMCSGQWEGQEDGFSINDVIQNNPRQETIVVHRTVTEIRQLSEAQAGVKRCVRLLREDLKTEVGGIPFTHSRVSPEQTMREKACHF